MVALGQGDIRASDLEGNPKRYKDLEIDEPILQSDPDLEVRRLRARNAVQLNTRGLLPFLLEEEKGEGVPWSREDLLLPKQKDEEAANEKLEVGKEGMKFLLSVVQPPQMSDAEMMGRLVDVEKVSHAVRSCRNSDTDLPSGNYYAHRHRHFFHCRHRSARRHRWLL